MNPRIRWQEGLALAVIIAAGALLRGWGLAFGWAEAYHWDEDLYLNLAFYGANQHGALFIYDAGSLNPYLLILLYSGAYLALRAVGAVHNQLDLLVLYLRDSGPFLLLARVVMAGVGCAGVAAVWLLGRRLAGTAVGLLAALFTALAFIHASESHYVKPQVPAALLLSLATWHALEIVDTGRLRHYVCAGVLAGLTLALWYLPLGVLLAPFLAHHRRLKAQRPASTLRDTLGTRPALLPLEVTIATFVLVTPYAALTPGRFIGNLKGLSANPGIDTGGQPFWLATLWEIVEGLGWPLAALGMGGALLMGWRCRRSRVLVLPALANYLLVVTGQIHFARYQVILLPALAIGAAWLLVRAVDDVTPVTLGLLAKMLAPVVPFPKAQQALQAWWRKQQDDGRLASQRALAPRLRPAALALAGLAVVAPSAVQAVRFDLLAGAPDTRTLACRWIEANVPAGSSVAVEAGVELLEQRAILGPPLVKTAEQVLGALGDRSGLPGLVRDAYLAAHVGQPAYVVANLFRLDQPELGSARRILTVDDYRRAGVAYLVTSNWAHWRLADDTPPSFRQSLDREYELVQEFHGQPQLRFDPYSWAVDHAALARVRWGQPLVAGPEIRIYRLRAGP